MAVVKTNAYYNSTDGMTKIHAVIWRDDSLEPRAKLQLIHGAAEHIERYDAFASFMASKGYVVFGNDHIGHGKSLRYEDRPGDFGAENDDVRLVDDVNVLNHIMKNRYPSLPCFVLGQDMGSFIARIFAADFPDAADGLIICGTTLVPSLPPELGAVADALLAPANRDAYTYAHMDVLGKIAEKLYREDDETSWISASKANRDRTDLDLEYGIPLTTGSLHNLAKLLIKSSSADLFARFPRSVPVMLICGGKDMLGLFGRNTTSLDRKFTALGISCETRVYPGLRHDLLNEDRNDEVFSDVYDWCETALASFNYYSGYLNASEEDGT